MPEKKIIVVVRGGVVESILTNDEITATVEVIDLDRPSYETTEETGIFYKEDAYVEQIKSDSDWKVIY